MVNVQKLRVYVCISHMLIHHLLYDHTAVCGLGLLQGGSGGCSSFLHRCYNLVGDTHLNEIITQINYKLK